MVAVKVCGNRSEEELEMLAELGVDMAGLLVVPVDSPRRISLERAAELMDAMPSTVAGVLVLMPKSVEEAVEMYQQVLPDFIQLHGSESPAFVRELRSMVSCNIIKTVHVSGEESLAEAKRYLRFADAILLDTPSELGGGSGRVHRWDVSARIAREIEKPVILAGGLTPENVREAVEIVKPYGVDVASGVEASPGVKDPERVREFVARAKDL
ncbi:MAG: phosphoribosylanthranilate isomerase [Euryarchaeota archaeon]|nr:phosphoribosylanthranilate isomerase [Euryarchaeota archaeon]